MSMSRPLLSISLLLAVSMAAGCRSETPDCADQDGNDTSDGRNDTLGTATEFIVSEDGRWEGAGHICPGDSDWYSFTASAGQLLEVDLGFTQSEGDLQLELLNGEGSSLALQESITDGEFVRLNVLQDGTYYLKVNGRDPIATDNTYTLTTQLTGVPCESDQFEPNDSHYEAAELNEGSHESLTLCYGEADWYEIPAADGQIVKVDALYDPASTDVGLTLYRRTAAGNLGWLAGGIENASGRTLVRQVSESGPFLLRATRGSDVVNADYALEVDVSGVACIGDVFEPNDGYFSASPITSGTAETGLTLCVGDRDWYEIEVANGQLIDTTIEFDHAEVDLGLQLYQINTDGSISYRSGSNTLTDNETIRYRPFSGGTYVMQVYPSRGSITGSYDLYADVTGEQCVEDDYEPNNTSAEAVELAEGDYGDMTLCIGDDDWYLIEASQGQLIDAAIRFDHDANDLGLTLYKLNADGTITTRANANTLSDDEVIKYRPFESGDFILRTYRTRGTQIATYTMEFALQGDECIEDTFEPNNDYPQAVTLDPGNYPDLTLCIGDVDWYTFEAENGQLIDVDISFSHADSDLALNIYKLNDDGTLSSRAGSNTLSDNESVTYQPFESGTFAARVARSRGTQLAAYDLDIAVSGNACVDDAYEPNDNYNQLADAPTGTESLTLCVGDADWFKFSAEAGQLIHSKIAFSHAANDLGINVYRLNEDGTVSSRAGSNTLTDDEEINYRPYDSGDFALYVYRTRGTQVASYDVTIDVSGDACPADPYEPNNASYEPSPLAVNASYEDLTLCVGDDDWYSFQMSAGQLFKAEALFDNAQSDLGINLYHVHSDGTLQSRAGSNSITSNESIAYRPYENGDWVFRVYRTRGTQLAEYDLNFYVEGDACEADAFEPNNSYLQTTDFGPLDGSIVSNLTNCPGDEDWYSIGTVGADDDTSNDLRYGTVVDGRILFSHDANDLGLQFRLLAPDKTLVESWAYDSISDNEYAIFSIPVDREGYELIARVYRTRGTQTANYEMAVKLNAP